MAGNVPEDEEDLATDDPWALKMLRANAKRRFTKTINLVRDLMADHGSRTFIRNRRDDIVTAYQECDDANTRYTTVCPDDETSPAWINSIEIDRNFWVNTVDEHLISRVDMAPSNVSQIHSQYVPLLDHSSQRRPTSNPDWTDLRLRVNQLELQGIHGYAGSPSLHLGRSPPLPPPRPSSSPGQHDTEAENYLGARLRVDTNSFIPRAQSEDVFMG